jgi:hypothetical protein
MSFPHKLSYLPIFPVSFILRPSSSVPHFCLMPPSSHLSPRLTLLNPPRYGHVLSAGFESLLSFSPRVPVNVRGSLHLTLPLLRALMQLIKLLLIIPILALPSEGNLARLEASARMRQKLVEIHHGNSLQKHLFFTCSKPAIATYLLEGGVFYARITHAVPRSGADDALATTSRTPGTPKCAFRHIYPSSFVRVFADQHSKLTMSGHPLVHEVPSAVRPASGPCRTAHGQHVRRGEPQTSLGERDVRGTELDPGVSFPE